MKKLIVMSLLAVTCVAGNAYAYLIDGSVNDWGIDLSDPNSHNRNYLDTHTPIGAAVDYTTEDNADYTDGFIYVAPGWSIGNTYDAEAMYFDNDANNAYLAIVTGLSKTEAWYPAGDIFIDLGKYQDPSSFDYNPKKYEYAIDILTSKLYQVNSWQDTVIFADGNPWKMGANRTFIADIPFVYSDGQNSHYVLEAGFPLASLGLKDGDDAYLHWAMMCGNDQLNLHGTLSVVPEPATMTMFGIGLAGLALRRKRTSA